MGACLPCCKCSAFFGIIFYVVMGVIVLTQSEFLKFGIQSTTSSGVACFIVALIELGILIGIIMYQRWQQKQNISRENYVPLDSERRPRQSTFKGIAMGDLKVIRQAKQKENQPEMI